MSEQRSAESGADSEAAGVAALDRLPEAEAAAALRACCGAPAWIAAMMSRRPFGSATQLYDVADHIWRGFDPSDWRSAFDHHPRLGEQTSTMTQEARARDWSGGEQAGLHDAGDAAQTALAEANAAYETRFGYICIICASGRHAPELLSITLERLANVPEDELAVAAEEQRKITRLRLGKLVHDLSHPASSMNKP
jgi:2-oxo-4-hydroxy-4-carboxy-5-ureidoimidazoline decarboxylase